MLVATPQLAQKPCVMCQLISERALREEAELGWRNSTFDRQAAQIAPIFFRIGAARRKERPLVVIAAEQDGYFAVPRRPRPHMSPVDADLVSGDIDDRGLRMRKLCRDPRLIAAMIGAAVDCVGAEAQHRALACCPD